MRKDINLKILERYGFKLYKRPKENVYLFKKRDEYITIDMEYKIFEPKNIKFLNFHCIRAIYNFMLNECIKVGKI